MKSIMRISKRTQKKERIFLTIYTESVITEHQFVLYDQKVLNLANYSSVHPPFCSAILLAAYLLEEGVDVMVYFKKSWAQPGYDNPDLICI